MLFITKIEWEKNWLVADLGWKMPCHRGNTAKPPLRRPSCIGPLLSSGALEGHYPATFSSLPDSVLSFGADQKCPFRPVCCSDCMRSCLYILRASRSSAFSRPLSSAWHCKRRNTTDCWGICTWLCWSPSTCDPGVWRPSGGWRWRKRQKLHCRTDTWHRAVRCGHQLNNIMLLAFNIQGS